MFEIHEVVEGVSKKGPMKIKQFLSIINIRLIWDNLTIK